MHTNAWTRTLELLDRPDARRLAMFYGQGERKTHVVAQEGDEVAICGRGVYRGPWDTTGRLPAYMRHALGGSASPAHCADCVRLAQQGVGQ